MEEQYRLKSKKRMKEKSHIELRKRGIRQYDWAIGISNTKGMRREDRGAGES